MKIDYITDVDPAHPKDSILRIFDFDRSEAYHFREILSKLADGLITETDLTGLAFVTPVGGCRLILKAGSKDRGIVPLPGNIFECILTKISWQNAEGLVAPFCDEGGESGYQWLYDLHNDIDLLFSRNGDW
jgi:hypothetical protein